MTKKLIGWENRLSDYLRSVSQISFRPGAVDCGLFFGGGYAAMTGDDSHVKAYAGKYRTVAAAMKMLQANGFVDHVEYVASHLQEYPSPLFAQRGDCAVFKTDGGGYALGIVQGENVYLMTLQGVGLRRLEEAERAFAV